MRILPSGDAALLVELPDLPEMLGLYAALAASPPPGVEEPRPGPQKKHPPQQPPHTQKARS
ncbi:hypothetical protein ABWI04_41350, partial [Actinomadura sp. NPDC000929]